MYTRPTQDAYESSGGFEFFQLKFELLDPPPHTSVQTDPTEVETANLPRLPRKSDTAAAIRYALSRWPALARFVDAGQLEIDKNAAERALGRKNYLFAGSNRGGERAAALYSLIGSAKLNGRCDHPPNRCPPKIAGHLTNTKPTLPQRVKIKRLPTSTPPL